MELDMSQYQSAMNLLIPIWRGIPPAYKQKYARNIWDQFENQIKSAAYTNTASIFLSKLCQKLNVTIRKEDVTGINQIINGCDQTALLKQLRKETILLVLMVREDNDLRKQMEAPSATISV